MKLIQKIKYFFAEPCCNIGFIEDYIGELPQVYHPQIHWLKIPKDRWYADPFILEVGESEIEILVEEYIYKINKGRLARLVIDRSNYSILSSTVVLEQETHLSFPAIYRDNDGVFVYPENNEGGTLSAYQYSEGKLLFRSILINEPLVDSVHKEIEGKHYIFATKMTGTEDENDRTLFIYQADNFWGPYVLFQKEFSDTSICRGAGDIIENNGKLIRPAQNCEGGYGKEVIFNAVVMRGDAFEFSEIKRIGPKGGFCCNGIHTYNQYKGIVVIDGLGYRRGLISKFIMGLNHKIKKSI